ncbi:hypothetical protein MY4824_007128 [Beauveria thailandica]
MDPPNSYIYVTGTDREADTLISTQQVAPPGTAYRSAHGTAHGTSHQSLYHFGSDLPSCKASSNMYSGYERLNDSQPYNDTNQDQSLPIHTLPGLVQESAGHLEIRIFVKIQHILERLGAAYDAECSGYV